MAKQRPDKTLADYLAIAVSPVLIMVLVGSLTFFLQGMLYQGQFDSRVKWILFWFVLGSVLIARIAIESGREHASIFTLGLGAVVSLAVFKFVPEKQLAVIGCLALIWWLTDKLTWDCTLIDETEDASGEGLLQVAGVGDQANLSDNAVEDAAAQKKRRPFWMRLLLNTTERAGRPHAPGLWVVYFSLMALPVFGFGQAMIPRGQTAERGFAFQCLFCFVGAALGLLMLTSFLGLRRYLRQRGLQMPPKMAATWVGVGSAIGLGILIVCLLLPRPQGEFTVTAMIDKASDKIEDASKFAMLKNDGVKDPNQPGSAPQPKTDQPEPRQAQQGQAQQGQAQQGQAQQGQAQQGQAQQGQSQQGQSQQGQSQQGQSQQGQAQQGQAQQGQDQQQAQQQQRSETQPTEPPASSTSTPEMLGNAFRWGMYGLLGAVGLWLLVKYWKSVAAFLTKLWNEFLSLFRWSAKSPEGEIEVSVADEVQVRSFAEYSNPFQSGRAKRVPVVELVRYSFEALQAWAAEHDCPRRPDHTPMEFGQRLIARKLPVGEDGHEVAQLYARVAYARFTPNADCLPLLERLWRGMNS